MSTTTPIKISIAAASRMPCATAQRTSTRNCRARCKVDQRGGASPAGGRGALGLCACGHTGEPGLTTLVVIHCLVDVVGARHYAGGNGQPWRRDEQGPATNTDQASPRAYGTEAHRPDLEGDAGHGVHLGRRQRVPLEGVDPALVGCGTVGGSVGRRGFRDRRHASEGWLQDSSPANQNVSTGRGGAVLGASSTLARTGLRKTNARSYQSLICQRSTKGDLVRASCHRRGIQVGRREGIKEVDERPLGRA